MYQIIPSPGTQDKEWSAIEKKLQLVKPFAKTIHIDVLDGKFANNTTFLDPKPFAAYTKDTIFEVHLMVEDPIRYVKPWADAGFQRFIGQVEKMPDQVAFVAEAQLLGEVGLALDKQTPVSALHVPLNDLDMLLLMSVQAGFSGQEFSEDALQKIVQIRQQTDIPIEVDGGINDETILIAASHGATRFVTTSFLFDLETPEQQFALLEKKLQLK